jgi:scyllo-inositol 2-dehydrogenase (NADP+)
MFPHRACRAMKVAGAQHPRPAQCRPLRVKWEGVCYHSTMSLRLGIVGYGRIGADHARWIAAAAGLSAVAVSDPVPQRRELAGRAGLKSVADHAHLFKDPDIDAILIATPTSMHFEQAACALRMGKHVMIEKPMTTGLDTARQLVELAERCGRVLSVFHNRRWDIDFLTLKRAIDEGVFGRVVNVESRLGQWASCVGPAAPEWRPGWRNEAGFGGGGLFDWGSHFLDQVWRMKWPARPTNVFAQLRGNVWTNDCDDLARVCIDFDDGSIAMVEVNTTTTQPLPRWHVDGTAGSASSPFSLDFDTGVWAELSFSSAGASEPRTLPRAVDGLSEIQLWERFASACRGEGEPAVRPRSVLPTMLLLEAARQSSASGRVITLGDRVEWVL